MQSCGERGWNYLAKVCVGEEVRPDGGLAGVLLVAHLTPVTATVQRRHLAHLQSRFQPLLG